MSQAWQRIRDASRVGCPFCWEWIPSPRLVTAVYSPEGCLGGRCSCGAVFVVDETGHSGGQAVLDVQALLCDGDLDAALALETDVDVEIKTRSYAGRRNDITMGQRGHGFMPPQIWFARRCSSGEGNDKQA